MSNMNEKPPQNNKASESKSDAHEQAAEPRSMFDDIKDYFKNIMPKTAEDVPAEQQAPDEKPVSENAKGDENIDAVAKLEEAAIEKMIAEEAEQKAVAEDGKPKELTLEDIEKLQAAAAGEAQDSGFSVPATIQFGNLGNVDSLPRDLGIGPFPPAEEKILPTFRPLATAVDHPVEILDLTPKLEGGDAVVNENDLLASRGPGESAGSDPVKESTTVSGDFKIVAPDGVDDLIVGGHNVITNGVYADVSFTTPLGNTLHITGYNSTTGVVTYEYTLNDNEQHPAGDGTNDLFEDFAVYLSDTDGDEANGTLSIRVIDDVPSISVSESLASLIVDESFFAVNDTASFAGLFNAVPGADGATIVYTLNISAPGADSGLVDTQSNDHVLLYLEGNDVVGRAGNDEVFRISIDPNTGEVTLDQSRAVVHPDSNDPNDVNSLAANDLITLTATITDSDFDVASATRDIGLAFQFRDDGPSIDVSLADKAPDLMIVDETDLSINATADFSDNFIVNPNFGADGAGSIQTSYQLIIPANGTDSGLIDVATGQHVLLSLNGDVVEGRTAIGNDLVFTVSVDGSGIVTLDQIRALQHSDPNNPDDSVTLASGHLIQLKREDTIIDKDGDSASDDAILNIGKAFIFKDDGPHIDIGLSGQAPDLLQVDETNLTVNATANFADNFVINSSSYGADGAGSLSSSYTLSISSPGADSGLIDVATGQHILLSVNGGVVEGRTEGSNVLVFTVSVDGAGNVTLDQIRALQHADPNNPNDSVTLSAANLVQLTRTDTIIDKDGDHASSSATLNIGQALSFLDDAPHIDVSLANVAPDALVVDETNLAQNASANFADNFIVNSSYGADGADGAGSISSQYTLSISSPGADSGLIDVATGQHVLLSLNGGVVEGRTEGSNVLVFTVSVDNAGVVTLDQIRALQHADPNNPNDSVGLGGANLIQLTRTDTIIDKDGDQDSSSATLNIGQAISFLDDAPHINVSLATVAPDALVVDETNLAQNASANFADNFVVTSNYGADGAGSITTSYSLSISANGADSGLIDVATGQHILLSLNGGVVEGRTEGSNALVFTVSVDNAGIVTLDQIRALQHADPNNPNDSASLSAANLIQLTRSDTIIDRDGDHASSSATLNIGQAISFLDDGPNIDVNQTAAPILTVDESNYLINDSASFAGLFTSSFGADGPKDTDHNGVADADAITYKLGILAPGTDSGLVDTDTNQSVLLTLEGGNVVGRAGLGGPIVFTLSVDANTGVVTLDQSRAVVHANTNDPNDSTMLSADNLITLTATIRDGDLDSDSATKNIGQAIKFQDDGPTAVNDCFDVPLPVQPKYNLTFVLDISGSMDSIVSGNKSRLDILKEALTNSGALLDSYQAASTDLKITIITFSSGAQTSLEFSDVAAAKAYINALDANGTTNYQAAANAATADVNSDSANPALAGYIDRLYWISDGEPNPTSTALTDAQELAWRNNLNADNVEAYMLNIGGSNANINEHLADLDDDQPGTVITVAPDLSNLQQILIDTINQSEVQGNVLANDIVGADVHPAVVNIYFMLADNAAANAYLAAHPELVGATVDGNKVTIPIPNADITTPLGNLLHMESDGDFTYTSNQSNNSADEDILYYTMRDGDGDKSSAEFCFNIDFGVTITNLTPKAEGGDVTVDEDDLLANRGLGESAGSDTSKESTTQPGNFTINAPNGVDDVTIGGHAVITNGVFTAVSFATPLGNTLSILSYNPATGVITYEYTLNDNEAHPNANGENNLFEDFTVTLSDTDGDSANATLSARIIDDVPDAINDTNASIASENNLVLTGNVRANDIQGADGATVTPVTLVGTYGTVVIAADGSYTYTLNINDADFKALGGGGTGVENFNYTLVDADGDADTARLTLNIKNDDDGVLITDLTPKAQGGDASVDEDDLLANRGPGESAGSDPTKESTTTTGNFTINAPDGVGELAVGGHAVITNGVFTATSFTTPLGNTLNITGYNATTGVVSYSYTLNDNETHPSGNGENSLFEDFAVSLKDVDGDTANDTLSIKIVDDVPDAIDDTNGIASESNLVLTGNVRANDIQGADGATVTPVTLVGTYGTVVIAANGDYTYTLNINDADFKALGGGGTGVENFNYTLTDADGDADSAKLTLSIKNNNDGVLITDLTPKAQGGDASVDEDDLLASRGPGESAGSDPTKESTTATGNFRISAPDGVDTVSVGGHAVITNGVFTAISFATPLGNTLNIIGYNPATGVISYEYTLNDNEAHPNGNGENSLFEDFAVSLKDVDGDTANDTLSIKIVDDVPDAIDDTNGIASESNLVLTGNVRANDIQGADGATVTPVTLVGTYGTVVIAADGSYTYTLNINDADFKALGGGGLGVENFNYTLTDSDGDADTAKLTLNIRNNDDGVLITDLTPKAQGGDAVVDEDDLLASRGPGESAGSDPTKESTTTTGNFKISAPDGVDTVSVGGHAVITNGVFTATSFATPLGNTLSITGYNATTGVISYSYTLNDNENHPTGNGENSLFEDFAVTLKDVDGDTANDTLSINIIDDVPTAVEDCFTVPIPVQPSYNLTFVLDISGSMDSIVSGNKSRLDILKEALTNNGALLDSYDAASSALRITIITFSSSAQTSTEFSDVASAKAFINSLDANGTTNYQAAANAATADVNSDSANPALSGFIDRLYWLSDGEPNPGNTALSDAQELAWRNNLNADNVEAYMLNIGGSNANINEHLADLDDDQPGTVITVAPDLSNLQQILVDTINQVEVNGNVLTNDVIGADGNGQVVNVYFNLASAQAANAYLAAHPELVGATVNGNQVTIPVPNADITTPVGNVLHMNADGSFTYISKAENAANGDEDILFYTMRDNDGDRSSAEFCFDLDFGVTITNLTPKAQGGDVSVNEDDLLASRGANESAGSDTSKESTTQGGNFNINAPNGVNTLTIGGQSVINNGVFTAISFTTPLGNTLNITGYNPATGLLTYLFTLNDNEIHPNADGKNVLYEDFNITVVDKDGDSATGTLSAGIVDDVPDAINDTNPNTASESLLVLTGNVRTNDIQGADGANVVPVNLTGKFGSIVISADGSYTYTLNVNDADFKALGGNGTGSESFTYTLTDADGDSDTAVLSLNIKNNNDGVTITDLTPKAQGGDVSVDEDDLLASRGPGESAGSDTTKESTTQAGSFTISAPDGVNNLSVGGHSIIANGVFTATSFATPLGNTLSFTGYNATTGAVSYTYTLNDNESHPTGNGENSLFEDLNIVLSDKDGSSASDTLSLRIVDDVPTAAADDASIVKPALPAYNLVFTLDISGSMGDVIANTGGKTRLQILKEALTSSGALLDSYQAASSALHITFVTFSTNAQTSQAFTDVQAAKNFINGLSANGSTNYIAAMSNSQTVMTADKNNASLTNYIDKTYFISDGQPNVGTPNSSQYNSWQTNISNNNVDAIILNIAPPANQQNINQYLTPLANPTDNPAVYGVNADLSNLQGILISTINDLAHINGNVLANDVAGADGPLTVSQIQFSFANAAAATAYFNAHPELVGKTIAGSIVTIPVPQNSDIATPLGEKLHINSDGSYTYTIDANAVIGKTDSFTYMASDSDGDVTSAQVQLHIVAPQSLQMTVTSFAATSTVADTHESSANNDIAFATTKAPYADNLLANDVIGDKGAKVVQISFETDDAAKYIKENHLESINAVADKDGKTVHVPLPADGSEVEFATPNGGSLAANQHGEYAYTANSKVSSDAVEHFTYTLQDQATGNLHDANLDVNVYKDPASLVNLMGSDDNDIMSTANHNANVIMMEGGKGINDFIVDLSEVGAPETIYIKDLGINKQNVLSFVNVSDSNHDGQVNFMDAVESFHQSGPDANLEITLNNKTTLVLENVGTVPGHDMQALQQHLESITAELHVTK